MKTLYASAAVAAILAVAAPADAQYLDGHYDYWAGSRVQRDAAYATAWYGENNWYNRTGQISYVYTPASPYTYSAGYNYYPGGVDPFEGDTNYPYGNVYSDTRYDDEYRDDGFSVDF